MLTHFKGFLQTTVSLGQVGTPEQTLLTRYEHIELDSVRKIKLCKQVVFKVLPIGAPVEDKPYWVLNPAEAE